MLLVTEVTPLMGVGNSKVFPKERIALKPESWTGFPVISHRRATGGGEGVFFVWGGEIGYGCFGLQIYNDIKLASIKNSKNGDGINSVLVCYAYWTCSELFKKHVMCINLLNFCNNLMKFLFLFTTENLRLRGIWDSVQSYEARKQQNWKLGPCFTIQHNCLSALRQQSLVEKRARSRARCITSHEPYNPGQVTHLPSALVHYLQNPALMGCYKN